MNFYRMVVPPTRLKGIGDEPLSVASDEANTIVRRSRVSLRGAKTDQHSSFPKGLPIAFHMKSEYLKD